MDKTRSLSLFLLLTFFVLCTEQYKPAPPPSVQRCLAPLKAFNIDRLDLPLKPSIWRKGRDLYQNMIRCMFTVLEQQNYTPCANINNSRRIYEEQTNDAFAKNLKLGSPYEHIDDFLAWSKPGSEFETATSTFIARHFHVLFTTAQRNCTFEDADFCKPINGLSATMKVPPYCSRSYCFKHNGSRCRLGTPTLQYGVCKVPEGAKWPGLAPLYCDHTSTYEVKKAICPHRKKRAALSGVKKILKRDSLPAPPQRRCADDSPKCPSCTAEQKGSPCFQLSLCCTCP